MITTIKDDSRRFNWIATIKSAMRSVINKQYKVFYSVIIFYSVYMVNVFCALKNPANIFFNYKAMLKNTFTVHHRGMVRLI